MRHVIPIVNWPSHLSDAIEQANDGDTIVCHNGDEAELGQRAHARMCPDKILKWEIQI